MNTDALITVIVPTGNRIDVIEDCLRSVRWADELVVVDSFSNDGTYELARQYADRVVQHEYVNSAVQKNWIIPQATHKWVMIVDTDERVPPVLRDEIRQVLSTSSPYVGYRIPRANYMLGQEIRHSGYYPDYQTRLFQRDLGRYELREVHAHVLLDGPGGTLRSPLIHYTHRSLDQTLRNLLILMTTWEAGQRRHENPRMKKLWWAHALLRPPAAFATRYFRQGGWRDGAPGLAVSLIWAMYVAITYLKIWEQSADLPERWWQKHWQVYLSEQNEAPIKDTFRS